MDVQNSNTVIPEIWQVEAGGQLYETNFEELTQWITEGALLPEDKVKRGNLRWIEARKVPSLYGFFNGKVLGIAPPTVLTTNVRQTNNQPPTSSNLQVKGPIQPGQSTSQTNSNPNFDDGLESEFCVLHPDVNSVFVCNTCTNTFCRRCPTTMAGGMKLCPMCGADCQPIIPVTDDQQGQNVNFPTISEGFGFVDFGRALAYPFKYKVSLFFGALLFMFFSIGQQASSLGGRWLISGAIISGMLANMLTFGILSNTVENLLQERLHQNFMPNFDDFGIWDDVVHPFFLSLGVYLSSFGAFILLIIVMFFFFANSIKPDTIASSTVPMIVPELAGNHDEAKENNEQPNFFRESIRKRNEESAGRLESAENGEVKELPGGSQIDEEKEFRQINEMVENNRKRQLETTVGQTSETPERTYANMFETVKKVGLPFLGLATVFLGLGMFYLPVAYIVAAYTRNLASVFNPLVGIDTIKRLGFDYVKILLMGFILLVVNGLLGFALRIVFAPLDLPRLGNIPASAIGSIFTFYFSIVFSLVLGYALYKNSDKFQMNQNS